MVVVVVVVAVVVGVLKSAVSSIALYGNYALEVRYQVLYVRRS